jgi:transposase, IS5 family
MSITTMYQNQKHYIEDHIVNSTQSHVRPFVRGKAKAKAKVVFGAKIAISIMNGYAVGKKQWDNFNEGTAIIDSVAAYKTRFGFYPKAVLADNLEQKF